MNEAINPTRSGRERGRTVGMRWPEAGPHIQFAGLFSGRDESSLVTESGVEPPHPKVGCSVNFFVRVALLCR